MFSYSPVEYDDVKVWLALNHLYVENGEDAFYYQAYLEDTMIGAAVVQDSGRGYLTISLIKLMPPYDTPKKQAEFVSFVFTDLSNKGAHVRIVLDSSFYELESFTREINHNGLRLSVLDPVVYYADAVEWAGRVSAMVSLIGALDNYYFKPFSDLDAKTVEILRQMSSSLPSFLSAIPGQTEVMRPLSMCVFKKGEDAICGWSIARARNKELSVYSTYSVPEYRADAIGIISWYALFRRCQELGLTDIKTLVLKVDTFNKPAYTMFSHFCDRKGTNVRKRIKYILSNEEVSVL